MVKVKFNMVDEFIEEITKDKDSIDRKIVRVTKSFTPARISPNIQHVSLCGNYSVSSQLVYLERYCGDIWGINNAEDRRVIDKADDGINKIQTICKTAGLEIRAGLLEEEGKQIC